MEVNSYPTRFQTRESIEELKRKINIMALDDIELLIVEPCSTKEHVFMRASKDETNFVYMYEDILKKLNVQFPFLNFECEMLSLMNVFPVILKFITLIHS